VARAALLQLDDLPASWDSKPRSPSTSDTPEAKAGIAQFAACLHVDPAFLDTDSQRALATAKTDKFSDTRNLDVEQSVTINESAAQASEGLPALAQPEAKGCFKTFIGAAAQYGLEHPSDGSSAPEGVTIGTIEADTVIFHGVPDGTIAWRATIPLELNGVLRAKVVSDFVIAVKGRADTALSFNNLGQPFPPELEDRLVKTAIGRLPDA
jgi:hypothetical protein